MKHNRDMNPQKGVALFFALLALLLLTALATSLIFMSTMETEVNSNYRSETKAYYAARSGVQEARDRLRLASGVTNVTTPDKASVYCSAAGNPDGCSANTTGLAPNEYMPVGTAGGVLYIYNGTGVQPWNTSNTYADDELCEAYPGVAGMSGRPTGGLRCSNSLPTSATTNYYGTGGSWYNSVASAITTSNVVTDNNGSWGTNQALDYKWARITIKNNGSIPGLSVDGSTCPGGATCNYPVCYNGSNEYLEPPGTQCAAAGGSEAVPVYLVTSLAVTPSGTRRMVESEVVKSVFPNVQSTFTFAGASVGLSPPSSHPPSISGCDAGEGFVTDGNGGCQCPGGGGPSATGACSGYPTCSGGGNKPAFGTLGDPTGTSVTNTSTTSCSN